MAKRNQQAVPNDLHALRVDAESVAPSDDRVATEEHLVTFRLANDLFAFRLNDISEVIRLPNLAHMPLGPRSLLGLANLRGVVFPVVATRRLLGLPDVPSDAGARVIVIDGGAPVGFIVDRIDDLLTLAAERVEKDHSGAGSVNPDVLDGIIKGAEGEGTIKILNPQRLLRDDFARLGMGEKRAGPRVLISPVISRAVVPEQQEHVSLISFDLAQQEYALPLDRVREIITLPDHVSEVPRFETAVLGVVTFRDRLLPLVSLRALLGLPVDIDREDHGKVVVLSMGDNTVGMIADRTREILRVAPDLIDPAPALLTRGTGDAEIASICRLEQGRRLVAVLSPDRLFRSELVKRVLAEQEHRRDRPESQTNGDVMADEQFIIFRLGDQEYGLPIDAVDEIARAPDHITRLPKSPAFVDGVMNLRGIVVPIVDLRRRFEIASLSSASAQRILVLAVGGGKTGFMVDNVSEVMKVPVDAILPAPEVSAEQMRLIGRVANLDAQGRMILLVDPVQLLNRVEADMLTKFDRSNSELTSQNS